MSQDPRIPRTLVFPECFREDPNAPERYYLVRERFLRKHGVDHGRFVDDQNHRLSGLVYGFICEWPQQFHQSRDRAKLAIYQARQNSRYESQCPPPKVQDKTGKGCDLAIAILRHEGDEIDSVLFNHSCSCVNGCRLAVEIDEDRVAQLYQGVEERAQAIALRHIEDGTPADDLRDQHLQLIVGNSAVLEIHDRYVGRGMFERLSPDPKNDDAIKKLKQFNVDFQAGRDPDTLYSIPKNFNDNLVWLSANLAKLVQQRGGRPLELVLRTEIGPIQTNDFDEPLNGQIVPKQVESLIASVIHLQKEEARFKSEFEKCGLGFRFEVVLGFHRERCMPHERRLISEELCYESTLGLDMTRRSGRVCNEMKLFQLPPSISGEVNPRVTGLAARYRDRNTHRSYRLPPATLPELNSRVDQDALKRFNQSLNESD